MMRTIFVLLFLCAVNSAEAIDLRGDHSIHQNSYSPKNIPRATSREISMARRYLGGNPTGRRSKWCADFMNLIEKKMGRNGTGSRASRSYLNYGKRVSSPKPGDIVVLSRRGGGHVGYFMSWAKDGRMKLISGNHSRKVGIGYYPKSRVLGYRRPVLNTRNTKKARHISAASALEKYR